MSKNLFLEINYKRGTSPPYVGSGLRMQAKACVHRHTPTYVVGVLDKFSTIMAEVWNESHIVQEPYQTPLFPLYKALHGIFSRYAKNLKGKLKIHQKIVNQKGVFHKTPSSHFSLIGTFSNLNLLSLNFLITVLLNCDRF